MTTVLEIQPLVEPTTIVNAMNKNILRWVSCLSIAMCAVLISTRPVSAAAKTSSETGSSNLSAEMLDGLLEGDLGESLLEPREPSPAQDAKRRADHDWLPDKEMLRRRMLREAGLPEGKDVGQKSQPMASVIEGMRRAEALLEDLLSEEHATPVQRQVVVELEKLIKQMEKQCQGGGQCDKPSDGKKQASQRSKSKPAAGSKLAGQKASASQNAARDSTARMGSAKPSAENPVSPGELMKAAWGNLPQRVREKMLQSSSEEFLPEYREELEAYYRRLAEREAEQE